MDLQQVLADVLDEKDAQIAALRQQARERDARIAGLLRDGQELRRQLDAIQTPPTPSAVISRAEFGKRIAPAYLRLPEATEKVQRKWDRILGGLLSNYEQVTLTDPTLAALVGAAVDDGLLTEEEAQAALAVATAPPPLGPP